MYCIFFVLSYFNRVHLTQGSVDVVQALLAYYQPQKQHEWNGIRLLCPQSVPPRKTWMKKYFSIFWVCVLSQECLTIPFQSALMLGRLLGHLVKVRSEGSNPQDVEHVQLGACEINCKYIPDLLGGG